MACLRPATLRDIPQIQRVEEEYYEGFHCPEGVLREWIAGAPQNFIIAVEAGKVAGFIFFEYLDSIRPLPFVHNLEHDRNGKFAYVSEIGVLEKFRNSCILQRLVGRLVEKSKSDGCKAIAWLTGSKARHDMLESGLMLEYGFRRLKRIKGWEAFPDRFVDDHCIWTREIS